MEDQMSYELVPRTTRRAPKVAVPDLPKAYRKPPKEGGRETCCDIWDTELTGRLRFKCSVCGGVSLEITPRFCPCCGRKVVYE